MVEKRLYPRIQSEWKLYLTSDKGQKQIGHVRNISLSGALLFFTEEYKLETEKHKFTLKLKNKKLQPSESVITGLKEWTTITDKEIILGLNLEKLGKKERSAFIRFLSRSENLHIEVFLMQNENTDKPPM